MGLDNKNDYKYSNVNAHDVWFNEKEDRKIQPIFKDVTSRNESHIYNRKAIIHSQKFYDADYNLGKPRLLDSVTYKPHPKSDLREKKHLIPTCLKEYVQCPYTIPNGRFEAKERK
jgi:hypothetical protein